MNGLEDIWIFVAWLCFAIFMWWLGFKAGELKGMSNQIGKNKEELDEVLRKLDEYKRRLQDEGDWWKLRGEE